MLAVLTDRIRIVVALAVVVATLSACGPVGAYDFTYSGAAVTNGDGMSFLVVDCYDGQLEWLRVWSGGEIIEGTYQGWTEVWSIERGTDSPGIPMGPTIVEIRYGEPPDGYVETLPTGSVESLSGTVLVEWRNSGGYVFPEEGIDYTGFRRFDSENMEPDALAPLGQSVDDFASFSRRNCSATT